MGKRTELNVTDRTEAVLALLRREEPAAKIARRFVTPWPARRHITAIRL